MSGVGSSIVVGDNGLTCDRARKQRDLEILLLIANISCTCMIFCVRTTKHIRKYNNLEMKKKGDACIPCEDIRYDDRFFGKKDR